MIFLFLLAFSQPDPPSPCVIDRCERDICTVETPEGWVDIERRPWYVEGLRIVCPLWLIEPT